MSLADEKVLNELSRTMAENCDGSKALMAENIDMFSADVMPFEDITAAIMDQTEDLFLITRSCDRLAPEYLKFCRTLEKAVDHLGSAFVTKIALESYDRPQPKIKTLSAERLSQMISFNIRKCNAALTEYNKIHQTFHLEMYEQLLRFGSTMCRLRATQKRAHNIALGNEDMYKESEKAGSFTDKDPAKKIIKRYISEGPFRSASSYEVRRDVLIDDLSKYGETAVSTGKTTVHTAKAETPDSLPPAKSENTALAVASTVIDAKLKEDNSIQTTEAGKTDFAESTGTQNYISGAGDNKTGSVKNHAGQEIETENPNSLPGNEDILQKAAVPDLPAPDEISETDQTEKDNFREQAEEQSETPDGSWMDILPRAAVRGSRRPGIPEGSVFCEFTNEELLTLSKDRDFLENFPDLAQEIIRHVRKMDSG